MLLYKTVIRILKISCFMIILTETLCAKILAVLPVPSISHQVVFRPLTQELARRGHEITIITPNPAFPDGGAPENLQEIDIHDVSYQTLQKLFRENHTVKKELMNYSGIRHFGMTMAHIFIAQLQIPEIQQLIFNKNNKYDLILIEAAMRPALIFSHIFKAPVILVSSLGAILYTNAALGIPTHPILYPPPTSKKIYNLTLAEKINEIYMHYSIEYAANVNEAEENELLKQSFGPEIPPLSVLYNNIDMLFINIHPIWANNHPVPPSVIYMGGIHQIPKKDLPKDLKTYLDSSKRGVIYLSFGTNVLAEMIPQEKIKIFVEVLSHLSYDVLWKWDKDELPGRGENIRISKWYPQSDLLRHPNIKLFITQAGLQSTDEAISAGVPLVAVPMLGDQWYNAQKYVKHGIGKSLDIETVTAEDFKSAIETVINDKSYRMNIKKLRKLLYDQPETPLHRAAWWAEYVIRHGGAKHLRSPAANLSYAKYYEIEVVTILALTMITVFIISILFIMYFLRFLKNVLSSTQKRKLS